MLDQPIDQVNLPGEEKSESQPGKQLAQEKAVLGGFTERELDFDETDLDHVAISQWDLLEGLSVQRG